MTKRRQPNPDSRSSDADKAKSTPVFLQKIYKILDSSPEDVASWSDAGDTFIVKLPSRFAKEILPHYFKTDNFSSFVRQLNFYGFRKVSYEDSGARQNRDRKSWEFRHSKFLRGRPELLKEIRRKTYSDTNSTSKAEIEDLKSDVKNLKDTLGELRETMNNMSLVLMRALGGHTNPFVGISTSFQTLEDGTSATSTAEWAQSGALESEDTPGPTEAFGAMTRSAQPSTDDPMMPGGAPDATLPPSPGSSQQPNKRRRTRASTAAVSGPPPSGGRGDGAFPIRDTSTDMMRSLGPASGMQDASADDDDLGSFLDGFMNDDVLGAALAGGPLDPSASMLGMGPGGAPWAGGGATSAAAAAIGRAPLVTATAGMARYRGGMPAPDPSIGAPMVPTLTAMPSVAAAAVNAAATRSGNVGPYPQAQPVPGPGPAQ